MKVGQLFVLSLLISCLIGCSRQADEVPAARGETDANIAVTSEAETPETIDIAPGLTARILRAGAGEAAEVGDSVEVHYTGWLYDEQAPDHRGDKFDSSLDRGQRFQFPLGERRVIRGWEQGVAGMRIGELRELTIAPDLAYGKRGFPPVIPPDATLVFEVELFAAVSLTDPPAE